MTKQQLLQIAKTLGLTSVDRTMKVDDIRTAVNAKLGIVDSADDQQNQKAESLSRVVLQHGKEAIATESGAVTAQPRNIPNLSPSGQWEGKRARIRRVKTGHNDMGGAIFNWNGWPTIIPIDQTVDVAWPIFGIIQNTVGMKMNIRQETVGDKVNNVKDITHYDKYPFQFLGVTPGTEDLPESAWEYTLDAYVGDFKDFSVRMWRQLCVLWEINDAQANIKPGTDPDEESIARSNAIHYHLNLPQGVDLETRQRVRNEKRQDIGMEAKAA